jgi:hypothetical protein
MPDLVAIVSMFARSPRISKCISHRFRPCIAGRRNARRQGRITHLILITTTSHVLEQRRLSATSMQEAFVSLLSFNALAFQ